MSGVALLVIIGVGVGIGAFVLSQSTPTSSTSSSTRDDSPDENEDEDDEEDEDEQATNTPTPTPTEDSAQTSDAPVLFQSVSGNIVCSITVASAVCHQNNIKYTAPSESCTTSLGGATVGVDRRSAFWPCMETAISGASTVEYDVPVTAYGYSCNINYISGVTCYNADGSGFTMEYTNGIYTF